MALNPSTEPPASKIVGRPQGGNSIQTCSNIIAAAKHGLIETGCGNTTFKKVASKAGIIPVVIYSYSRLKLLPFPLKL